MLGFWISWFVVGWFSVGAICVIHYFTVKKNSLYPACPTPLEAITLFVIASVLGWIALLFLLCWMTVEWWDSYAVWLSKKPKGWWRTPICQRKK